MVLLVGLILVPLSFFYSPRVEKSHVVYFTKTMTISQERNSPAYLAFKETQKLNQGEPKQNEEEEVSLGKTSRHVVSLSTETIMPPNGMQPVAMVDHKNLDQMSFTKDELQKVTDEKIQELVLAQKNSTLMAALIPTTNLTQAFGGTRNIQSNTQNGIVIRGSFELKEGVGIVDHIVSLTRVSDGQTFELGQVDLRAGLYQIVVNSFDGELLAEIKDRNGLIVGEDRRELLGLKQLGSIFEGPSLKLGKPSSYTMNARYADDHRKMQDSNNGLSASLFSGNYELEKTNDDYPNVSRQSSTVGFIHDPKEKIINTLTLRTAQDTTETVLFSKLWVEGAISYATQKLQVQYADATGVIIGRVIDDRGPVENVRVAIDDQPGIEIFYLDEFLIPQKDKHSTFKNGYFFIPGLSKGSYQISVFDMAYNANKGSQLFVVDEQALAYQEISYQKAPSILSVYSYDAFTSQPMATDLILPGNEDIASIDESGEAKFRVNFKVGIQEIIAKPLNRDYVPTTVVRSGNENYVYLPQVSENWLRVIAEKTRIDVDLEKSIFIAFTATPEYTITMADEGYDARSTVFFSSTGELTSGPSIGGGVIFFNIKEGLQEAVLHESETTKVHSKAYYARPGRIYVSLFK